MKYKLSELVEYLTVPAFVYELQKELVVACNAPLLREYGMCFHKRQPVKILLPSIPETAEDVYLRLSAGTPSPVLEQSDESTADFQAVVFSQDYAIIFKHLKKDQVCQSDSNKCAACHNQDAFHLNYVYNIASGKISFSSLQLLQKMNLVAPDVQPNNLNWREMIIPEDRSGYDKMLSAVLAGSENKEMVYHIQGMDGAIYQVSDYCGVTAPDNQWPVLTGAIVCRQHSDDFVAQAEKQVLTGRMLGGMIHDFKNLLGGIRNIIEWSINISDDQRVCEALKKTLVYTDHATELIVGTLRLNQGDRDSQDESINIGQVVLELESLISRIIPSSTALKVTVEEKIPLVFGPKCLLKDLLLNLCVNARDAMKNKGDELRIDVRTVAVTDEGNTEDCVALSVSDDGCGMSKSEVSRIFDAFYSTKPQGAGLGMWMVRNAVNAFHGRIEVNSEVGFGTTVRVVIPALVDDMMQDKLFDEFDQAALPETPETCVDHVLLRRRCEGKTLLYIEDNLLIGSGVRTWLESMGFNVLFAADGLSGKNLFNKHHRSIDAIVQDFVLPGIKGDELLGFFKETRPDIPVIVVSAENDVECVNRLMELGAKELIRKPFKMDDLFAGLSKVLTVNAERETA